VTITEEEEVAADIAVAIKKPDPLAETRFRFAVLNTGCPVFIVWSAYLAINLTDLMSISR